MRIALTITELDPGGAETCMVELAKFLQATGHDVQVYSLGPAPSRTKLVDQLTAAGIEWKCGRARNWRGFVSVLLWLRRELKQFQPDVVQSMLFHANLITSLSLPSRDIPFFGGARVRQPQRWRHWLQRWSTKRMQKLICVSECVARGCREQEGIASDKVIVIPNGVDVQRLDELAEEQAATASSIPSDARTLLYVGRLDPQKQIELLVRRMDRILASLPEHHFVLIGDGPQRELITSLVSSSPHANRLHAVGWQKNPYPWMKRAEVLLLPAMYEGMPNVVIEAMGLGRPVISFEVEGVQDLLGKSPTAKYQQIQAQQFDQFETATVRLASDKLLQQKCGKANRERVLEHFQLSKQLEQYETLYQESLRIR